MQRKVYTRMYIYLQNCHSPIHTRQLPDRELLASREPQSCAAHTVPITRSATPPRLITSIAHRAASSPTWLQLAQPHHRTAVADSDANDPAKLMHRQLYM